MPTEVVLTGITCRIDADQDPEQLYCVWRGTEVETNTPFLLETSVPDFADTEAALESEMTAADYEFA